MHICDDAWLSIIFVSCLDYSLGLKMKSCLPSILCICSDVLGWTKILNTFVYRKSLGEFSLLLDIKGPSLVQHNNVPGHKTRSIKTWFAKVYAKGFMSFNTTKQLRDENSQIRNSVFAAFMCFAVGKNLQSWTAVHCWLFISKLPPCFPWVFRYSEAGLSNRVLLFSHNCLISVKLLGLIKQNPTAMHQNLVEKPS